MTSLQPLWKEPTQERGRVRVEAILRATSDLVAEQGHLDFKMSTVAERADVPIGSVYQFFPTRTALLARLFFQEMEPIDSSLSEGLAQARSVEEILAGIGRLIKEHVALVQSRPALFVIWSSPTMEPALQEADFQNSQASAMVIADRVLALGGDRLDPAAVGDTALVVCHLWGHVLRLSVMASEARPENTVIDQYISMIEAHFERLLAS